MKNCMFAVMKVHILVDFDEIDFHLKMCLNPI